jgi:branched-chain amino acid transport system ATP-binding protein
VIENVRVAAQALVSRFEIWRPRAMLTEPLREAENLLEFVGLAGRARLLAGNLSHGEQRSLEIAIALAGKPRLLLLDEPTAGMSPEETRTMMELIVKLARERTVVLVEHKMKLVMNISDHVIVLHHGEVLAEGSPDEIRANEAVKRVYLGQAQPHAARRSEV